MALARPGLEPVAGTLLVCLSAGQSQQQPTDPGMPGQHAVAPFLASALVLARRLNALPRVIYCAFSRIVHVIEKA